MSKIVLLDNGCNIADEYRDEDGALSICVPKDVNVTGNYEQAGFSDLENITSTYSNSWEQYVDKRTMYILSNIHRRDQKGVSQIRAYYTNDGINLIDGFLYVSSTQERANNGLVKYTFQLIGTHQQWKDVFKQCSICDVDLGNNDWEEADIVDLWNNTETYVDGESKIWPLLADFGKFYSGSNDVYVEDIPYVVFVKAFLDCAFCKAGYRMKSTFFSSDYGRRQAFYAPRNFGEDPAELERLRFFADLSADLDVSFTDVPLVNPAPNIDPFPFDNEVFDNGGYYNPLTYIHTGVSYYGSLSVDLELDQVGGTGISSITWTCEIICFDGISDVVVGSLSQVTTNGTNFFIFDTDNILIRRGNTYRVRFRVSAITSDPTNSYTAHVNAGANFFNTPVQAVLPENFNPQDYLDCSLSVYDLVQDFSQMYNLRFLTDEASKIVCVEPFPARYNTYESFDVASQELDGFQPPFEATDRILDITKTIDTCQDIGKDFELTEQPVSHQFKFKDSSDEYEKYDAFDDESNPLWGNTVDNPNGTNDQQVISLNVFEPTYPDRSVQLETGAPTAIAPIIPIMWRNGRDEDGFPPDKSFYVSPRIFCVFGALRQKLDPLSPFAGLFIFEGISKTNIPLCSQIFPFFLSRTGLGFKQVDLNNVFDDNAFNFSSKNLVNTFFAESLVEELRGLPISVKAYWTNLLFACFNAKKLVKIYFDQSSLCRFNGYYTVQSISKSLNQTTLADLVLIQKFPTTGLNCE